MRTSELSDLWGTSGTLQDDFRQNVQSRSGTNALGSTLQSARRLQGDLSESALNESSRWGAAKSYAQAYQSERDRLNQEAASRNKGKGLIGGIGGLLGAALSFVPGWQVAGGVIGGLGKVIGDDA